MRSGTVKKNLFGNSARWIGASVAAAALVGGFLALPAGAVTSAPYKTLTTVTSSAHSTVTGAPLSYSISVIARPSSIAVPTYGQVTVSGVTCDGGSNVFALNGSNTVSCAVSGGLTPAQAGVVSATYVDTVDGQYRSSTGTSNQVVNPARSTTTLTSSANPSKTGEGVSFTASTSVVAPGVGALTGAETFTGVTCDGGSNVIAVNGSGQATCSVSAGLLAANSPVIVGVSYGGDPNFATSASSVRQITSQAATSVAVTASPNNCSGDICALQPNTAVSFTALASSSGSDGGTGVPAGNVTFSIVPAGGNPRQSLPCDGGTNTFANGSATCTIAAGLPSLVYYTVTATLSDPNYAASTGTLYEETGQTGSNISVSVPKGLTAGASFPITAVVTPAAGSGPTPSGVVEFSVCGNNNQYGCQGGTATLDSTGTATFTVGGGEYAGYYRYYANYLGDGNYLPATAPNRLFLVGKTPTQISVSSTSAPAMDGTGIGLTASLTVRDASGGAGGSTLVGPPTGAMTWTITDPSGASFTCQDGNYQALNNGITDQGVTTCYLPAGTLTAEGGVTTLYRVTVSYSSDGNYSSSSSRFQQVVVPMIS